MGIDKIITDNTKVNENLLKENQELKETLQEVLSQLNDRGGFDVLILAIKDKLK
tara:strand:+ start:344 stop:505 length:162 start_codon:yes stop_codon:yes gene_type:complete